MPRAGVSSGGMQEALIADEYRAPAVRTRGLRIVAADPLRDDPRMKRRLSYAYCGSMVCVGLCFGAQGPATLALAEQCGIVRNALSGENTATTPRDVTKLDEMGIATSLDAIAGIAGTLLGGWLVDRLPLRWHWVLCVYMLWQGLAFSSWTVVTSFPQLIAASVAWGFASTMPSLSTQAAMTWVWGADVAPWMQLNNAAFGLGSLIAPLLVSLELRERDSFHWTYRAVGLLNLCVAFVTLPYPTPRPAAADGSDEPLELVVIDEDRSRAWEGNKRASTSAWVDVNNVPLKGIAGRLLRAIDIDTTDRKKWMPQLKMYCVFYPWFFVYVATEIGFSAWVSPYATLRGLASEADAAMLTSTYYGAFTVTRLLSAAPFARRFSSRKILWSALVGSFVSLCVLLLTLAPLPAPAGVVVLWVGSSAFGACQGPLWPAMMSLLSEEYGLELRTTHTALVLVMSKCGIAAEQMLLSTLLGSDATSWLFLPSLILLVLATAGLQCLLFFWALPQCGMELKPWRDASKVKTALTPRAAAAAVVAVAPVGAGAGAPAVGESWRQGDRIH